MDDPLAEKTVTRTLNTSDANAFNPLSKMHFERVTLYTVHCIIEETFGFLCFPLFAGILFDLFSISNRVKRGLNNSTRFSKHRWIFQVVSN